MREEIMTILKLVEEGKITAEEGDRLITALESKHEKREAGKYIRLMVNSHEGKKVNLRIPLGLASVMLRYIPKDARMTLDEHKIDVEELILLAREGKIGEILDVETEEGDKVKIWIE